MRILDKYIFKNVMGIFLGCLSTFMFLYLIVDIFSRLEDLLRNKVTFDVLTQFYLGSLPSIFIYVAPFCCLLAVLYTFSKLNRDNEIIAMRASGLSIMQMTRTVLVFGAIISLAYFLVNNRLVPVATALTQKLQNQVDTGQKKPALKDQGVIMNLAMYGMKNRLFFVNKFTPKDGTMEGITILENDSNQNVAKKIVANKGVFKDGLWTFYQSITYEFEENGQIKKEPGYLDEEIMTLPETPDEFANQREHPEQMTIKQIRKYLDKLSESGAAGAINKLTVELYLRYTSALTPFMLVLLAIPFSLIIRKKAAGLSSLGVSIIGGFLYYVINAVSVALGYSGILSPFLAASLSHILLLTCSIYMIRSLP